MKLIVGLGNPGPKYETTRHNAGFLAVDRLIEHWNAQGPQSKFKSELFQAKHAGEVALLIKPQTYMNNSGESVAQFFNFYKLTPADLFVIHDELDLPPMSTRLKVGGGTGGHNGLKSIDAHLGSANNAYVRMRIGVGKPVHGSGADYLLDPFTDEELTTLDGALDVVPKICELFLENRLTEAMNQYNRRENP